MPGARCTCGLNQPFDAFQVYPLEIIAAGLVGKGQRGGRADDRTGSPAGRFHAPRLAQIALDQGRSITPQAFHPCRVRGLADHGPERQPFGSQ